MVKKSFKIGNVFEPKSELDQLKKKVANLETERWLYQHGLFFWLICMFALNLISIIFKRVNWLPLAVNFIMIILYFILLKAGKKKWEKE